LRLDVLKVKTIFFKWAALTQWANRALSFPQEASPYTFLIGRVQKLGSLKNYRLPISEIFHANLALNTQIALLTEF
jgi:hypothetical protein